MVNIKEFEATYGRRPKVKTPIAAQYLGLAKVTLDMDRSNGRLGVPFHRLGKSVVYDLDELDAWLESRRSKGEQTP